MSIQSIKTLVVGAGDAGTLAVKRMLADDPDMPGNPIGFADDDSGKQGKTIAGIKVIGTCDDIPQLCEEYDVGQIVIAVPSANLAVRDRVYGICMSTGKRVLTLPAEIKNVPSERVGRIALREVDAADLLSRDEIELDPNRVGYVTGKRVLVTGGGGSIGGELVRQLIAARPAKIVLFDIYENTTYELYHELVRSAEKDDIELVVEIGSIVNPPAIEGAFDRHRPDVVFHAAAHKHVPLMETCPREAVENNVFGTLAVARLAHLRGCSHFIFISTDKAVNPTSVMGATKRVGEMIVQRYAEDSDTVFSAVRFGNVLGSHGSVIPLFRRQMRDGGPVTVTHRDVTRYFMTIPEAARLVITAGALAKGGEVFVLDMGEPVRVYDLAEKLIRLSGLVPGRDIEIEVTGLRPGEKLYEELTMEGEDTAPTANGAITVSTAEPPTPAEVEAAIARLRESLDGPSRGVKRALAEVVGTYTPDYKN